MIIKRVFTYISHTLWEYYNLPLVNIREIICLNIYYIKLQILLLCLSHAYSVHSLNLYLNVYVIRTCQLVYNLPELITIYKWVSGLEINKMKNTLLYSKVVFENIQKICQLYKMKIEFRDETSLHSCFIQDILLNTILDTVKTCMYNRLCNCCRKYKDKTKYLTNKLNGELIITLELIFRIVKRLW